MNSSFICEKCGSTLFEQYTYTQAKCLECGYLSFHDSGIRTKPQIEYNTTQTLQALTENKTVSAPLIKRFLNYLLDIIFIVFALTIIITFSGYNLENDEEKTQTLLIVIFFIISPFYYILMEFNFGKTLGKIITKTKVISTDGQPLSLKQCILRTLCRIIPFERFSGLFFNGAFWHDTIPKTKVVEDN